MAFALAAALLTLRGGNGEDDEEDNVSTMTVQPEYESEVESLDGTESVAHSLAGASEDDAELTTYDVSSFSWSSQEGQGSPGSGRDSPQSGESQAREAADKLFADLGHVVEDENLDPLHEGYRWIPPSPIGKCELELS